MPGTDPELEPPGGWSKALAAEAQRLGDDPADGAERRAVMAEMEELGADWPE